MPAIAGKLLPPAWLCRIEQFPAGAESLHRYQPRDEVALLLRGALAPDRQFAVRFQEFVYEAQLIAPTTGSIHF
jgi:hypothetical protein